MKNSLPVWGILLSLFTLVVPMLPAGAGQQKSESAEGAYVPPAIILWTWDAGHLPGSEEGYNAAHPNKPVKYEFVIINAQDYMPKLQQSYASGGDLPDVISAEMSYRASLFAMDIWERFSTAFGTRRP
jgi:multiple sugar transport system substrate-binding protein